MHKTVIFVTHDIDEAIKMGDRIAIMRDGRLVQMATADELLAMPVNDFVASFVGADRGLKRLRVRTLDELELGPPPADGQPTGPTVPIHTSLHNALSKMLADGTTRLEVTGEDGRVVGTVRLDMITALVAPRDGTTAPTGETIRLLSMPESFPWYMDRLQRWGKRIPRLARPLTKGVTGEGGLLQFAERGQSASKYMRPRVKSITSSFGFNCNARS